MSKLKADTVYKDFWRDNTRFASLFNAVVFGGEEVIDPDSLEELDTDVSAIVEFKDQMRSVERARDVIKKTAYGVDFVILGLENQQRTHYGMPLRVMIYDALGYLKEYRQMVRTNRPGRAESSGTEAAGTADDSRDTAEIAEKLTDREFLSGVRKEDRFHPIISLVVSYDDEPWDGPLCLRDMMVDMPKEVAEVFTDYRMNLMEVRDSSKYSFGNEDVRTVFEISSDILNGKFGSIHSKYRNRDITAEQAIVIGTITEFRQIIEQAMGIKGGMMNMCKSLEQLEQRGIQQGISQRNREIAVNMLIEGMDRAAVARMTELSMEEVEELTAGLKKS